MERSSRLHKCAPWIADKDVDAPKDSHDILETKSALRMPSVVAEARIKEVARPKRSGPTARARVAGRTNAICMERSSRLGKCAPWIANKDVDAPKDSHDILETKSASRMPSVVARIKSLPASPGGPRT